MGIPKDVAKVGVRHGMWGAVKKLQSGMRAYQLMRKTEPSSLSRHAIAAQITTKVLFVADTDSSEEPEALGGEESSESTSDDPKKASGHGIDWKWIAIGGVAIVCGLQTGLIGKALLIGAARRIGRN